MTKHDERAFPLAAVNKYGNNAIHEGMTLWDYFAAHAPLPAISSQGPNAEWQADELAHRAANYADAMMAERTRRQKV